MADLPLGGQVTLSPDQIASATESSVASETSPSLQIGESTKLSSDQIPQTGQLDPLRDFSADQLVELQKQTPEFQLIPSYAWRRDLQEIPGMNNKIAEAYMTARQSGNWYDKYKGNNVFETATNIGQGVLGSVAGFIKGMGKVGWNYANALATTPLAAVTAPFSSPETTEAIFAAGQRRFAEGTAGIESGLSALGTTAEEGARFLARKAGIEKPLEEYTPDEKVAALFDAINLVKKNQDIAKGHGPILTTLGNEVVSDLESKGLSVRPEETAALAEGDPFSFYLMGAAFHGVGKLIPTPLSASVGRTTEALGNAATQVVGRGLESAADLTKLGATAASKVAPIASAALGAMKGAELHGPVGLVTGAGLGYKAGQSIAEGLKKAAGTAETVSQIGEQISGKIPVVSSSAQLIKDIISSAPGGAVEAAKGSALDLGLAAVTSEESPENRAGIGLGTVFGALGMAKRIGGKALSGQIIAPRRYGTTGIAVPSSGSFPAMDQMHNSAIQKAPPGEAARVNAARAFANGFGSDLFYSDSASNMESGLRRIGVDPAQAKMLSEQEGFFSADVNGKRIIGVRNIDAAPHESFHAFQDVIGEGANQILDQIVKKDYAPVWEQEGYRYTKRLMDSIGKSFSPEDWREHALDESRWGAMEAAEKISQDVFNRISTQTGATPDPAAVRQIASGELNQKIADAAKRNPDIPLTDIQKQIWRDILSPQEAKDMGDKYLARELAAENFDAVFKHTGPTLEGPPGLLPKFARIVANVVSSMGGNPLEGRVSQIGQQPLSFNVSEAVRNAAKGGTKPIIEPPKLGGIPVGIPATPQAQQAAATKARDIASTAPDVRPAPTATLPTPQSPREVLDLIAEAIEQRTGVKLNTLSAPGEPAAATTSNRATRRSIIEVFRSMPQSARALWEKTFFPERVLKTKNGKYQVLGWAPEVFAANAHKVANALVEIESKNPGSFVSPYELDPKTKTFSDAGWKALYKDVQTFVKNQIGGRTGAGEKLTVPEGLGAYTPHISGTGESLDQRKADFINLLFNFRLPDTARITGGKVPLNLVGQEVSTATKPGRVEIPIRPRPSFTGEAAQKLGIEGKPILEVNPVRNALEKSAQAAGVPLPSMIEAVQRLNAENIVDVQHEPNAPEFRGNTLTLTAGFEPKTEAGKELEKKGLTLDRSGILEGGERAYFVRKSSGIPIASLYATPVDETTVKVDLVYVSPDYQNSRIAETLYRELATDLQQEGITALQGDLVHPAPEKIRKKLFGDLRDRAQPSITSSGTTVRKVESTISPNAQYQPPGAEAQEYRRILEDRINEEFQNNPDVIKLFNRYSPRGIMAPEEGLSLIREQLQHGYKSGTLPYEFTRIVKIANPGLYRVIEDRIPAINLLESGGFQLQPTGAEAMDRLKEMSSEEMRAFKSTRGFGGGGTAWAHEVGADARSQEDLNSFRHTRDLFTDLSRNAMKIKDYGAAADYGLRSQLAREAFEAATGRSMDNPEEEASRFGLPEGYEPPLVPGKEITPTQAHPAPFTEEEARAIEGGTVSKPARSYAEASPKEGNPWVRRSATPEEDTQPGNSDRQLLVQITSDLMNPPERANQQMSTPYYDKLYSGAREGYTRMDDFWEIPQWMGFVSKIFPKADVYVVRNMEQAKKFLNEAKYDRVMFSALDVNKEFIRDLAKSYPGKVDIGGWVDPKTFSDVPNAVWHDSLQELSKAAGVDYVDGVDYRHFVGSDSIPRLNMSTGCKYKCAFCSVEKAVKTVPQEVINQQADDISKLGTALVYLGDKTFGQAPNYQDLSRLKTAISERNPKFKGFVVQTTASQLLKIPTDWLKNSGIKFVELGIESYNDPILKAMHKPATESLMDQSTQKLRENGIVLIPNIIIGLPGEDANTYQRTLGFLQNNADIISHANIYNLAVYEDAELGKKITTASPDDFNENVLEKSFHTDPEVHRQFAGDVYGLASKMLEEQPTPLKGGIQAQPKSLQPRPPNIRDAEELWMGGMPAPEQKRKGSPDEAPNSAGLAQENLSKSLHDYKPKISTKEENGILTLTTRGGRLIGKITGDHAEVLGIEVSPSLQRKGIGTALLDAFSHKALGQGAVSIGGAFISPEAKAMFDKSFGTPFKENKIKDWEPLEGFHPVSADYTLGRVGGIPSPTQLNPKTDAGKKLEERGYKIEREEFGTGVRTYFVTKDGEAIAELSSKQLSPTHATVDYVDVNKADRKQGIAEALYRELATDLQTAGITTLTGYVVSPGPAVIRNKLFGTEIPAAQKAGEDISSKGNKEQTALYGSMESHISPTAHFQPGDEENVDFGSYRQREPDEHPYFGIGHTGNPEDRVWVWNSPRGDIADAPGEYSHSSAFGHESHEVFRGRYDKEKNQISVVFPDKNRDRLDHEPTEDDIPNKIHKALKNKYGSNAKIVAFQPNKGKEEWALRPASSGFSKAWILPTGQPVQLGGQWHHDYLNENEALRKEYGLKATEDQEKSRTEALKKGFVRINYDARNGRMTVEAREADWPGIMPSVKQLIEKNLGKIDSVQTYLFNRGVTKVADSGTANLFDKPGKEAKLAAVPFIGTGGEVTEMSPQATPGALSENVPTRGAQAQPPSKDELDKIRSGKSGGQTFNAQGGVWDPKNKDVDLVSLASVNVPQGGLTQETFQKAMAPYEDLLNEPGIVAGVYSFSKAGKPTVSIDVNAVVPQEHRENTLQFAKDNDQESIWDVKKGETVSTGGKGNTKLISPGEILDAFDSLSKGEPVPVEDILTQHREPGETLTQESLGFGGKEPLSTVALSNLTKAELAKHYPEAVIPRRKFEPIPSDIRNSPLAQSAGSEDAAIDAYARRLVEFANEYKGNPIFKQGERWYAEFSPQLKKEFGAQADIMAELLAATSPRTDVQSNFAYALDALEGLNAGRFNKVLPKYEEGLRKLESNEWENWYDREVKAGRVENAPAEATPAAYLAHWINKFDLKPKQSNGKLFGTHSVRVLQVIARRWNDLNTGPKTRTFVSNLLGTAHDATIDVWADRTMRRLGYSGFKDRWRILPGNTAPVSDADFSFSQKAFSKAAETMGIKPDALQGALWFAEKQHWADEGWARLDLGSFQNEMKKIPMLQRGIRQRTKVEKAEKKIPTAEPLELGLVTPRNTQ